MHTDGNSGLSAPLGATLRDGGVNFSLFSRRATGVELLFFDREDDSRPTRVIAIDPRTNRTYHYWHVFVPSVKPGQIYGYRVHGAFDPAKILLDPYARAVVVPKNYSRDGARTVGDNTATAMKSVVVDSSSYDWEGDKPLMRPSSRTIVYEMHVRGFTRHPNSGVARKTRGTYRGLIERFRICRSSESRLSNYYRYFSSILGLPIRAYQLLGLCAGLFFFATSSILLTAGPTRPCRRVSRHGQSFAPGGNRSHSRCRIQSHGRRRPQWADCQFSRDR